MSDCIARHSTLTALCFVTVEGQQNTSNKSEWLASALTGRHQYRCRDRGHSWQATVNQSQQPASQKAAERGERPFLWPLTSFPDRHTYSVHSVQYCLSSCFEHCLIAVCGLCRFTNDVNNLKHTIGSVHSSAGSFSCDILFRLFCLGLVWSSCAYSDWNWLRWWLAGFCHWFGIKKHFSCGKSCLDQNRFCQQILGFTNS